MANLNAMFTTMLDGTIFEIEGIEYMKLSDTTAINLDTADYIMIGIDF